MAPQLAFYSLNGDPRWACAPGRWVKVQEAQWIKACKDAGALVYYRPFLQGDDGSVADAHAWAHDVWTSIVATGGTQPDALVFRNEVWATEQTGRDYVTFYRDLRAAGYRGLIVCGSFADGEPDFPPGTTGGTWDELHAGLDGFVPDAYDVHCYFEDDPDGDVWHSLRHLQATQRGYLPASARLFAGELGQTDGWIKKGWTAEEYAARLLRWRDLAGPRMEVAWVFADDDTSGEWRDFPIRGTAADAAVRMTWSVPSPPPAKGAPVVLRGADISDFQGTVNFALLAQACDFAYTKISQGTTFGQARLSANWAGIKGAGMLRGGYHYYDGGDPVAEARWMLDTLRLHGGPILPGDTFWLDLERPDLVGDLSGVARAFLDEVHRQTGAARILYTGPAYLQRHNLTQAALGDDVYLAVADYPCTGIEPATMLAVPGWDAAHVIDWQWAGGTMPNCPGGRAPGVQGDVDRDVSPLARAEFAALGVPQAQGDPPVIDVRSLARAEFTKLGKPWYDGHAIEEAYVVEFGAFLAAGSPDHMNPTPAVTEEATLPNGRAYRGLDDGRLLEWHPDDGRVYCVEWAQQASLRRQLGF